jgi:hypothetical protein
MEDKDILPGFYYRIKNRSHGDLDLVFSQDGDQKSTRTLAPAEAISVKGSTILANNKTLWEDIQKHDLQGKLTVRTLGLEVGRNYIIQNQTARRIGIQHYQHEESLILPPFGTRIVNSEFLSSYDILPWTQQSLITVKSEAEQEKNETALVIVGLVVILFILFLLVSIPLALFVKNSITWPTIGVTSAVFVVVLIISIYFSERVTNVGELGATLSNWLKLTPGIALVVLVGVGLPFGAVYFFGEGQSLFILANSNLAALGRLLQISFISIAAILPALLYYLFGRLQIKKQRANFNREAMLLDPNIQTVTEAETKYGPLLESVFGTGNSPFAILLLVISTALLVMGWVIALSPIGPPPRNDGNLIAFFSPVPTAFTLGFLGAYFFAINMIFRRYVRSDLTPKTYAYITVRMLVTLVLVWAVATLPGFTGSPAATTGLLAVAFVIGIFPDTGLALVTDFVKKVTNGIFKGEPDEKFPLSELEGINLYDRARMLEEGIENIENLAHHNLMELIARTRIPTPRLVDMFDQAILYIHLGIGGQPEGDDASRPGPNEGQVLLAKLKSYGIRNATGLVNSFKKTAGNIGNLEDALQDKDLVSRLKVIVDSIKGEEWLDSLTNWYDISKIADPIQDPYTFYEMKARQEKPGQAATWGPAASGSGENGRGARAEDNTPQIISTADQATPVP